MKLSVHKSTRFYYCKIVKKHKNLLDSSFFSLSKKKFKFVSILFFLSFFLQKVILNALKRGNPTKNPFKGISSVSQNSNERGKKGKRRTRVFTRIMKNLRKYQRSRGFPPSLGFLFFFPFSFYTFSNFLRSKHREKYFRTETTVYACMQIPPPPKEQGLAGSNSWPMT